MHEWVRAVTYTYLFKKTTLKYNILTHTHVHILINTSTILYVHNISWIFSYLSFFSQVLMMQNNFFFYQKRIHKLSQSVYWTHEKPANFPYDSVTINIHDIILIIFIKNQYLKQTKINESNWIQVYAIWQLSLFLSLSWKMMTMLAVKKKR